MACVANEEALCVDVSELFSDRRGRGGLGCSLFFLGHQAYALGRTPWDRGGAMENVVLVFLLLFVVSAFMQTMRNLPRRRKFRQTLCLVGQEFGLMQAGYLLEGQPLLLQGETAVGHLSISDSSPYAPENSVFFVLLETSHPIFSKLSFELSTVAWEEERRIPGDLQLLPHIFQKAVLEFLNHRCTIRLMDGNWSLEFDPHHTDPNSLPERITELQRMLEQFERRFATLEEWERYLCEVGLWKRSQEACFQALRHLLSHFSQSALAQTAFFALVDSLQKDVLSSPSQEDNENISWKTIESHYVLLSSILEVYPEDSPLGQFCVEAAFAQSAAKLQMLGALAMGETGYTQLHQLASASNSPEQVRLDALRHLLRSAPLQQKERKELLRRAFMSHDKRLQITALEQLSSLSLPTKATRRSGHTPELWEALSPLVRLASPPQLDEISQTIARHIDAEGGSSIGLHWLSVPPMIEFLKVHTESALYPLIRSFERYSLHPIEPLICAWLSHPSKEVRLRVVRLLGRDGSLAAMGPLKRAVRGWSRSKTLRQAIERAIARIEERAANGEEGRLSLLQEHDPRGKLSRLGVIGSLQIQEEDPWN